MLGMDVCDRCVVLLARAVEQAKKPEVPPLGIPDLSIDRLNISVRARNCLRRQIGDRLPTVAEFLDIEGPQRMKHFGPATFRGVVEELLGEPVISRDVLKASRVWRTAPATWRRSWLMLNVLQENPICPSL